MAELLILEFEGFDESQYLKVNGILGLDPDTGGGDWPAGLHTHIAGPVDNGWTVVEVWETREDQDEFMKSRLGPALHEAGVTGSPKRAAWSKTRSHQTPKRPSAATARVAS